jgi:hypothetical protein
MFGSNESEREDRCDSRAVGLRNVKADVGGFMESAGCGGGCNAARMEACEGSRSEASMSEREGSGAWVGGAGASGVYDDDAMASQAACSSSRLARCQFGATFSLTVTAHRFTSSSNSCNVSLFLSLTGFGFLTTVAGAVSS